jgi:hypothetical protein
MNQEACKLYPKFPKARDDEDIVVQEVFDEYMLYDLKRHKSHLLNPTAAKVWQWCDGTTPPLELSMKLSTTFGLPQDKADNVLWLTLDRLERAHLLEAKVKRPATYQKITRRQLLGLVGVGLLPVILSTTVALESAHASHAVCHNCTCAIAVCIPGESACDVSLICQCLTALACATAGGTECEACP